MEKRVGGILKLRRREEYEDKTFANVALLFSMTL